MPAHLIHCPPNVLPTVWGFALDRSRWSSFDRFHLPYWSVNLGSDEVDAIPFFAALQLRLCCREAAFVAAILIMSKEVE